MSDLARLRYFVAVAEELHFGRAAERLFIAQPALSQQIRKLEEQLGVTLLERDHRHVALTPAGEALLPEARAAVEQVDRAMAVARRYRSTRIGRLDIGYTAGAVGGLMSQIVRAFQRDHPDVELELHHYSFNDVSAGLRASEVDAAFIRLPLSLPDLRYRTLVVEPRVVALPPEHPLATRAELAIAELLDEPWIAIATNDATWRDHWLATNHRGGHPAQIGAEAATPDEAFEAVLAGRGVLLTRPTIAERFAGEGITTIPVPDAGPSLGAIAWQAATESALLQAFIASSEAVAGPGSPVPAAR
jgi:DNA-binding transcriptional LysR family regulator